MKIFNLDGWDIAVYSGFGISTIIAKVDVHTVISALVPIMTIVYTGFAAIEKYKKIFPKKTDKNNKNNKE